MVEQLLAAAKENGNVCLLELLDRFFASSACCVVVDSDLDLYSPFPRANEGIGEMTTV